jgi:hypothetical protein
LYFDISVYGRIEDDVIDGAIHLLRDRTTEILRAPYTQIPRSWYTPAYECIRSRLLERLDSLEDTVFPVVERIRKTTSGYGLSPT